MTPYYQDDWVTIYHADARHVLPSLIDIDATVTDPPYGIGFTGKTAKDRDGSVIYRAGGYEGGFPDTPAYIQSVVLPVIEACRQISRAVVVTPGTKSIWLYPEPTDLGCWYSGAGTGRSSWGFRCSQPILYYGKDPYLATGQGARPNSVGQVWPNDANQTGHPCAKPIQLMRWLVTRASLDGETVLDPFMGSGTTLVAAKHLGRKAIGVELSEAYCERATKRLMQSVIPMEIA